jgi:WD40 repeat protein
MITYTNENILKLIISNFTFYKTKHIFQQLENRMLCGIILETLDYENIFKSMRKSEPLIQHQDSQIDIVTVLSQNEIISISSITLNIWNINSSKCIKSYSNIHESNIHSVLVLPDQKILTASSKVVKIWAREGLKHINTLFSKDHFLLGNMIMLSNGYIAIYSTQVMASYVQLFDSAIVIFHMESKVPIKTINKLPADTLSDLVNLPDNSFAFGLYSFIHLYHMNDDNDCKNYRTLSMCDGNVVNFLFYERKNLLISASDKKEIMIWNLTDYSCFKIIKTANYDVNRLLLLSNGYFATSSRTDNIKIWHLNQSKSVNELESEYDAHSLVLLNDGRIMCVSRSRIIYYY